MAPAHSKKKYAVASEKSSRPGNGSGSSSGRGSGNANAGSSATSSHPSHLQHAAQPLAHARGQGHGHGHGHSRNLNNHNNLKNKSQTHQNPLHLQGNLLLPQAAAPVRGPGPGASAAASAGAGAGQVQIRGATAATTVVGVGDAGDPDVSLLAVSLYQRVIAFIVVFSLLPRPTGPSLWLAVCPEPSFCLTNLPTTRTMPAAVELLFRSLAMRAANLLPAPCFLPGAGCSSLDATLVPASCSPGLVMLVCSAPVILGGPLGPVTTGPVASLVSAILVAGPPRLAL